MTVTYTAQVATCKGLGCFLKLLRRWRGSIYKLVWKDLIIYLLLYYILNIIYRLVLNSHWQRVFESVQQYCEHYSSLIPISFVLGFYVSVVMTRWWNQYTAIPFPDTLAVFVSATIHGQDERGRVMRRTILRYVCLCVTMTFTMISPRVKKRFPSLEHFVDAGILQPSELHVIKDLNEKFPNYSKHWLPIVWASSIVTRARKEGRIRDDFAVKTILDELNKFRGQCGQLLAYDNISVPLVYTQVVTIAVYTYFLTTLMGHQWVSSTKYRFDLYFPVFSCLQFFFYVGWLKVAESLINPFGDDDDDFEVNWMVDRNLQVSYLIVDEMHHEHPELIKDQYWDEVFPQELPYTAESEPFRDSHPLPSTANIAVVPNDADFTPSSLKIDGMQSYADMKSDPIMFSAQPRKGSQNSIFGSSVPDSMPRINSISSIAKLKRMFSKEDKDKQQAASSAGSGRRPSTDASETVNLVPLNVPKSLAGEVIEEVDEQQTITSQRSAQEARPSVMNVFGPPPPSNPIDVPLAKSMGDMKRNHDEEVYEPYPLSRSAPADNEANDDQPDTVSIGGSETDSDDDFSKLKQKRGEERMSRLRLNLTRSVSTKMDESDPLINRRSFGPTTPTSDS
ncbi:bestrophin-2 isoform X2 [Aethina tumida]|uniref:bestrophin-2 isoform X2 n=1 Tax=Aethina tumida TaxID=116153 RepID=UPI00096B6023|nr:bestrophin-2 isoform X2 [Aethina tumida]